MADSFSKNLQYPQICLNLRLDHSNQALPLAYVLFPENFTSIQHI